MANNEGQGQILGGHPWEQGSVIPSDKNVASNEAKATKLLAKKAKKEQKQAKRAARRQAFSMWRKTHKKSFIAIIIGIVILLCGLSAGGWYLYRLINPIITPSNRNIDFSITPPRSTFNIAYKRIRAAVTSSNYKDVNTGEIIADLVLDNANHYMEGKSGYDNTIYKMALIRFLYLVGEYDFVKMQFEQINPDGYDEKQLYAYYVAGMQYAMVTANEDLYKQYYDLSFDYDNDWVEYGDDNKTITRIGVGDKIYNVVSSDKIVEDTSGTPHLTGEEEE